MFTKQRERECGHIAWSQRSAHGRRQREHYELVTKDSPSCWGTHSFEAQGVLLQSVSKLNNPKDLQTYKQME